MFTNDCPECIKYQKIIDDKDKKLSIIQNNMYTLKSKMLESSNMVNVYFNYKNENETLRKENENLKRKLEGSMGSNSAGGMGNTANIAGSKINYEVNLCIYIININLYHFISYKTV